MRQTPALHIYLLRNSIKIIGVYTQRNTAKMVNHKSFGDRSVKMFKRPSMGQHLFIVAYVNKTVVSIVSLFRKHGAVPKPTIIFRPIRGIVIESFEFSKAERNSAPQRVAVSLPPTVMTAAPSSFLY